MKTNRIEVERESKDETEGDRREIVWKMKNQK